MADKRVWCNWLALWTTDALCSKRGFFEPGSTEQFFSSANHMHSERDPVGRDWSDDVPNPMFDHPTSMFGKEPYPDEGIIDPEYDPRGESPFSRRHYGYGTGQDSAKMSYGYRSGHDSVKHYYDYDTGQDSVRISQGHGSGHDSVQRSYGYGTGHDSVRRSYGYGAGHDSVQRTYGHGTGHDSAKRTYNRNSDSERETTEATASWEERCIHCQRATNHSGWCPTLDEQRGDPPRSGKPNKQFPPRTPPRETYVRAIRRTSPDG